jgi:hypothetical protein
VSTPEPAINPPEKNGRPVSVTIMNWVFIATGSVGILYHIREFNFHDPFGNDVPLVTAIRLLAILGGGFALHGRNWARWLLLIWIAYHVALSAAHPLPELIVHSLLLVVVVCVYFRPPASAYFRGVNTRSVQ